MTDHLKVEFHDLRRETLRHHEEYLHAIGEVIESGWFILGPRVQAFEKHFAAYCGSKHAIGVANGTDAIELALVGAGLRPGDEVITTPISAAFSVLAILAAGCVPVFADVDDETLTIDPAEIRVSGKTRAILPVHLYGNASRMDEIPAIALDNHLILIEDSCQAHGSTHAGKKLGTFGLAGCFSFYPTKNLGGLGDGGIITTDDDDLCRRLRMLRNGGQVSRYHHAVRGVNSRLDELQAAVLITRLATLDEDNHRRNRIADIYHERLRHLPLRIVQQSPGRNSHLFVIRVADRERVQTKLSELGVGTLIHYPIPLHQQEFLKDFPLRRMPVSEKACQEILSLPIYPSLSDQEIDIVISSLEKALR